MTDTPIEVTQEEAVERARKQPLMGALLAALERVDPDAFQKSQSDAMALIAADAKFLTLLDELDTEWSRLASQARPAPAPIEVTQQLLSCPFCDDPMKINQSEMIEHVEQTKGCPIRQNAWPLTFLTAWNTRASQARPAPAPDGLVEALLPYMRGTKFGKPDKSALVPVDLLYRILIALRTHEARQSEGEGE